MQDSFDEYASILEFSKSHNDLTFIEFDHCTKNEVNLFAIRESFDFEALEQAIDHISSALAAIKRIFAHPIIRLKDHDAILSVESVRIINSKTVTHTAAHSELWDNVTSQGLKPRALLTLQNIDNYAIYENIILARCVDITLSFVQKNIRIMRDMLFACHDMKFNLLERDDHMEYFLAIGKLHMAYMRDYDKYVVPAQKCLSKLLFIQDTIRSRLSAPVYKNCRKKSGKIVLKKTNIFRNHKDYAKIYSLMKWYLDSKKSTEDEEISSAELQSEAYTQYCLMISLFAAGHFGFEFPKSQKIDFKEPRVTALSSQWRLAISFEKADDLTALRITLVKDMPYSVLILPITDAKRSREAIDRAKEHFYASHYVCACSEPWDRSIYLSVYDIQSFRKIQQILLGAMIYADEKFDVCPFCKDKLITVAKNANSWECPSCRMQISQRICKSTGEKYFESGIKNHQSELKLSKDALIAARQIAASMHYRNITPINERSVLICPICQKEH